MTRMLAELLEAKEPYFHQTTRQLEQAGGHNNLDVRLSIDVRQAVRKKMAELGLDPHDTTGEELYMALQSKLQDDERHLIKTLRQLSAAHVSAAADLCEGIAYALRAVVANERCYGIRTASIARLLRTMPPKRTMRLLGYRSLESLLKHEALPPVVAAAWQLESHTWKEHYWQALKRLTSRDCDSRPIRVFAMTDQKWRRVSGLLGGQVDTKVCVNQELSSLIIWPLPSQNPSNGLTIAVIASGLDQLNALKARGSYLKLSQVTPDFGRRLQQTLHTDPGLVFSSLNIPLSWETVQRFFRHLEGDIETAMEPHIAIDELTGWRPIEHMLAGIDPIFRFWKQTSHLAWLDKRRPVSVNLLDNALNLAHAKHYSDRIYHYAQRALWQEYLLGYIRPELLIQAINRELQPKLAPEMAVI